MAGNDKYDLLVIGGGPAGYAGAIRAAQLGKRVACIELERAGGTCLNWGCIPSKALLKSAELYETMLHAEVFGLTAKEIAVDFAKVMGHSRDVSDQMARGVEYLLKKNKIDYYLGRGRISVPGIVEITEGKDSNQFFSTENILISTGCYARSLPGVEIEGERILTSREALALKKLPQSIAIVGAGAIGVEFAYFFKAFGTEVTLIEMLPQVLPVEDEETSRLLSRAFKKQGIAIHVETKVENIKVGKKTVKLELVKGDSCSPLEVESLLLAVGVEANLKGLFSAKVKPVMDRGFIKVDDNYQSSVKGIYAAGDVIGPPWLAHVGTFEAVQAVNGMFHHSQPKRVKIFPGCTYCQPQVASVGMTEREVKEKGIKYRVGKFPFTAAGKAVAIDHPEGFVKLIIDEKYGEILGAHIIGVDATELITEYVLAMNAEITAEEIHSSIHAHPTMSEALGEAAAAALGEAIHI